jgi:hypothetical protein
MISVQLNAHRYKSFKQYNAETDRRIEEVTAEAGDLIITYKDLL